MDLYRKDESVSKQIARPLFCGGIAALLQSLVLSVATPEPAEVEKLRKVDREISSLTQGSDYSLTRQSELQALVAERAQLLASYRSSLQTGYYHQCQEYAQANALKHLAVAVPLIGVSAALFLAAEKKKESSLVPA